ncbi:MAG: hypothetical protein IJ422_05125 [Oscillospiraceae bacterium]|nr:hypothetical protein [Oscillospiraceae bacterium]
MILFMEGIVMCFILLIYCAVGIANGPVGLVVLYEEDVQARVVELGLTTTEKIRKSFIISCIVLFLPLVTLIPAMVYGINGATGFWDGFWQMTVILLIMGLFDRFFIDWYWVGHTKAWIIPGTEDLQPYIPKNVLIRKWVGTIIGYPLIAAAIAGVMTLI